MSVIITGFLVYNLGKTSVALTEADGPQTFSKEFEARLVSEGIAKYADLIESPAESAPTEVATAVYGNKGQDIKVDPSETGSGPKSEEMAQEAPEYSISMKAAELREKLEECQISYKVGMSKADMVAILDEYYSVGEGNDDEEPPNLSAEEPIT